MEGEGKVKGEWWLHHSLELRLHQCNTYCAFILTFTLVDRVFRM